MEIKKVEEGQTITYPEDGGEIILCPVCGAVWWDGEEYVEEPCQHLKFVFCTYDYPAFVFIADSLEGNSFITKLESFVESTFADEDSSADPDEAILDFLRNAKVTDVTASLVYEYIPEPPELTGFFTFYGYSQ